MRRRTGLGALVILSFMAAQTWGQTPAVQPEGQQVPRLIRFSGTLRPVGEKPASGVAELSFSLFKEESGGEPLWFESQTVEVDALGRYNVLLGAMHADGLPMDLFTSGEARWLSIMVGKIEQPRVLLVSVPYALKAGDAATLGGRPATEYVANDQLKNLMSDPNVGVRTLSTVALASSGGSDTPPALINETVPATFTCTSSGECLTVTQNGTGNVLFATHSAGTGTTIGVRGQSNSTSGIGVFGQAPAATGTTFGVRGDSASTGGRGIFGFATAATGATYGIFGAAASTSGVGLYGQATAVSGSTIGLRGESRSASGVGGVFDNLGGGKLISARTTGFVEKFAVSAAGNVTAAGTVTATSFAGSGANLTGVTVDPTSLIRGIVYLAGCDTCTALADTDDQQDFYVNVIGPLNIQTVTCYTDGGTPSINIQRDDGSPANILSSNLTCTMGGAGGTINLSEDDIAVGEKLDFVLNSAGGAKRITLVIKATL